MAERYIKLPKVVKDQWPESQPVGKFKAVTEIGIEELQSWLEKHQLSMAVKLEIEKSYLAAKYLTFCPCCGVEVNSPRFESRDDKGFKSLCDRCGAGRQLRSTGSDWFFEIIDNSPQGDEPAPADRWRTAFKLDLENVTVQSDVA